MLLWASVGSVTFCFLIVAYILFIIVLLVYWCLDETEGLLLYFPDIQCKHCILIIFYEIPF